MKWLWQNSKQHLKKGKCPAFNEDCEADKDIEWQVSSFHLKALPKFYPGLYFINKNQKSQKHLKVITFHSDE